MFKSNINAQDKENYIGILRRVKKNSYFTNAENFPASSGSVADKDTALIW